MNALQKLLVIKWIHTIIWAFFVIAICYVLYSGISGRISVLTWICIGLVVAEGVVLAMFGMSCPLTVLARKYSDSEMNNFDIFLPEWLAKYNQLVFTALFLIGVVLVLRQI